ncbi:MAG: TRL-like protein family [Defluviicoccus sp.]|nr:MAG: TRL-like protein family [Defluviicoccus sp.]
MVRFNVRTFAASAVVLGALAVGGCASPQPIGLLYYGASIPEGGTSQAVVTKSGSAQCTSILSLFATGDCTIETARKAGGIEKVAYVDRKVTNFLGLYGTYTTVVYGD